MKVPLVTDEEKKKRRKTIREERRRRGHKCQPLPQHDKLLAQGNVNLLIFDNDLLGGKAFGGEGANAFGFNSGGRLTNVATGKSIGTRLHRTHLILPDGTFRINHVRQGPLLNPDPR